MKKILLLGISLLWLTACGDINTGESDETEASKVPTEEVESEASSSEDLPKKTQEVLKEEIELSEDDVFSFMDEVNSEFFDTDTLENLITVGENIISVNSEEAYALSYIEFIYHLQYDNPEYTKIWSAYIQSLIEASKILSDNLGTYTINVNSPMGTGYFFSVTDGEIELDKLGIGPKDSADNDDLYYEANHLLDYPEFDDIAEANRYLSNQLDSDEYLHFSTEGSSTIFLQPLGETRDYLVDLNESLKYSDARYEEWLEYELDFIGYSMFIKDNIDITADLFVAIDMINDDKTFNIDSLSNEDRLLAKYSFGKVLYSPLKK